MHEDHSHPHGDGCGHAGVQHGDHVDHLHDAHRHAAHGDHYGQIRYNRAGRGPPETASRP